MHSDKIMFWQQHSLEGRETTKSSCRYGPSENFRPRMNAFPTSQKKHFFYIIKTNRLIFFKHVIAVYSENHTKPMNTIYRKCRVMNFKALGKYSYHFVLKGEWTHEWRSLSVDLPPLCLIYGNALNIWYSFNE